MKTLFDKIWDAHTVDTIAGCSCVGAETVVHFAFVGDLYVYFTQVVASPGDGLYQVFFQMYPSFGDAFYSIDGCIDRAVTAGCFGENISRQ